MDLELSETEQAFQSEARAWLAAHVPTTPLPSLHDREHALHAVQFDSTQSIGHGASGKRLHARLSFT